MNDALIPWTLTDVMRWSARELQNAQQLQKCGLTLHDDTDYREFDADDSDVVPAAVCEKTGFQIFFRGVDMFTFFDEFGTGRICYHFTTPGNLLAFVQNAPHHDDSTEEELKKYAESWSRFTTESWPGYI